MASVWFISNGNINNPAIYNTGSLPNLGDTVYLNGKTIQGNVTFSIGSGLWSSEANVGLGVVAGGVIQIPAAITLTGNHKHALTRTYSFSGAGNNSIIIGNHFGSDTTAQGNANMVTATASLIQFTGNFTQGTILASSSIISSTTASNTINITGDITGGYYVLTLGHTFTITGNLSISSGSNACIFISGNAMVQTINGNATNTASGAFMFEYQAVGSTFNFNGTATHNTSTVGFISWAGSTAGSTLNFTKIVTTSNSLAAPFASTNSATNVITFDEYVGSSVGVFNILSRCKPLRAASKFTMICADGVTRSFSANSIVDVSANDVRYLTIFDNGNQTGKLHVPTTNRVVDGTLVDVSGVGTVQLVADNSTIIAATTALTAQITSLTNEINILIAKIADLQSKNEDYAALNVQLANKLAELSATADDMAVSSQELIDTNTDLQQRNTDLQDTTNDLEDRFTVLETEFQEKIDALDGVIDVDKFFDGMENSTNPAADRLRNSMSVQAGAEIAVAVQP